MLEQERRFEQERNGGGRGSVEEELLDVEEEVVEGVEGLDESVII